MRVFAFLFLLHSAVFAATIERLQDRQDIIDRLTYLELHSDICNDIMPRLVYISGIEYYNLKNELQTDGSVIAFDTVAESLLKSLRELKEKRFQINKMSYDFGLEVKKNMLFFKKVYQLEKNVTGMYSCRNIAHGKSRSIHSYGMALDLNPTFNPYIGIDIEKMKIIDVIPKEGIMYLNMHAVRDNKPLVPGKIDKKIFGIFKKNGFDTWGGYWDFPIDSHHIQPSNETARLMAIMTPEDSTEFFKLHTYFVNAFGKTALSCLKSTDPEINPQEMYKNNPSVLFSLIRKVQKQRCQK